LPARKLAAMTIIRLQTMQNDNLSLAVFGLVSSPKNWRQFTHYAIRNRSVHPNDLHELLDALDSFLKEMPALSDDAPLKEWENIKNHGISAFSIFQKEYPVRLIDILGSVAPPLLFYKGNLDILNTRSVGFCGSRKASEKGLETARDIASQFSQSDINIVSGYASGVDFTTHLAALENNGTTTIVLPFGIEHFKIKRELENVWDWSRVLVISEFLPSRPWTVFNAMKRNSTICALSMAMILIEARETGGSMEAGKKCLQLGIPLFAPVYDGMHESASGNRILLDKGAHAIKKNRVSGKANISRILDAVENPGINSKINSKEDAKQVSLII